MKKIITAFALLGIFVSCTTPEQRDNTVQEITKNETVADPTPEIEYAEIDSDEGLIATALMAAPEESREGAKVIGYNMEGEFVTLKEGDNEFICLADDPKKEGFSAACYHKDLEPFMARGRQLRMDGKGHQEIFDIREDEVRSKKLLMAKSGATLHIYYGEKEMYNPETSEVDGAQYRYVVYMPYATAESTGLPEKPVAPNHPWIMDPGTHRAHIMITPLSEE